MNAFHRSAVDQLVDSSSSTYRTPPTGARNAAATPAAIPHVTRSLFSKFLPIPFQAKAQVRPGRKDPTPAATIPPR
eukprot:scaffold1395_cov397-Prasinococcus_capsulatus_cf.AAC.9